MSLRVNKILSALMVMITLMVASAQTADFSERENPRHGKILQFIKDNKNYVKAGSALTILACGVSTYFLMKITPFNKECYLENHNSALTGKYYPQYIGNATFPHNSFSPFLCPPQSDGGIVYGPICKNSSDPSGYRILDYEKWLVMPLDPSFDPWIETCGKSLTDTFDYLKEQCGIPDSWKQFAIGLMKISPASTDEPYFCTPNVNNDAILCSRFLASDGYLVITSISRVSLDVVEKECIDEQKWNAGIRCLFIGYASWKLLGATIKLFI